MTEILFNFILMTGRYCRYFKGNIYRVLHIAKHSKTLEDIVVYQAMYGERGIWVRPQAMFEEVIEIDRFFYPNLKYSGTDSIY